MLFFDNFYYYLLRVRLLELMSRFELPALPSVRQGRSASHPKVLPPAPRLTGLPPRLPRHRRRSAPPPLPRLPFREIIRSIRLPPETEKQHPFRGAAVLFGADEQIRTAYLLITNEVLYRLSYISARNEHYSEAARSLQVLFRKTGVIPCKSVKHG